MDVDSTLISQEVIDLLAEVAGVGTQVSLITEQAMRGEIDFEFSLRQRVKLLAGQPESIIATVSQKISLTPGARTLIRTLKKLGHAVGLVSGGFWVLGYSFGFLSSFLLRNGLRTASVFYGMGSFYDKVRIPIR